MAQAARQDIQDRKVQVDRLKLHETLLKNRDKHAADYQEALAGYKALAIEKLSDGYEKAKIKLEKNLASGKEAIENFDPANPSNSSDYLVLVEAVHVQLKVPRNFTKDYDAAIDMVQWDIRETLELTHAEFQCFVRDVWDWTNDFVTVSNMYKSSR